MALLVVLWTLLLVGIVGASVASEARKQGLLARNGAASARTEAAAEGGVIRAIAGLIDPRPELAWRADRSWHRFTLDGIAVEVRIADEAGKTDINTAAPELIAAILQVMGAPADVAFAVDAAVTEMRSGAVTGQPRGFETTSELSGVPGMTPPLFERVAPFLTVLTRARGVDPSVAPREVLAALTGRDPSVAAAVATAQSGGPTAALPSSDYLSPTQHSVFTIEAIASEGRTRYAREATIRLTHNAEIPFLVHAWSRRQGQPPPAGAN